MRTVTAISIIPVRDMRFSPHCMGVIKKTVNEEGQLLKSIQ